VFSLLGLCGYMAFDYSMQAREARARGEEPMSVGTYVGGLMQLAGLIAESDGDAAAAPETRLEAMLPKAPPGWTVRPSEPQDAEPFLPPGAKGKTADKLRAVVQPRKGKGLTTAKVTYQKGARRVIFELLRYPDIIFTSFMAKAQRFELAMSGLDQDSSGFATVRGLELREVRLPGDYGARHFVAAVGDQIHLRILASRSMTDEEMVDFLATLDVPSMNANVVEKTTGLGEVPVIVLASVLDQQSRLEVEAERALWEAKVAAEAAERQAQREAEEKAAEEAAQGITTDEETGIKLRKGTGEGGGSTFDTEGGRRGASGCRTEGGRKTCGVASGETPEG
jgi:hypothetical protein